MQYSLSEALTTAATAVVSLLKGTPEPSPQKGDSMSPAKRAHVTYIPRPSGQAEEVAGVWCPL